jgi:nucleoside-diphosphate-sugar epimerase
MLVAKNSKANGEVVNVGNTQETSILELAKKIKETMKSQSNIEFYLLPKDDPKRRLPDIAKLEGLVGWRPSVGLEDGLKRTITWFANKV